MSKSFHSKGKKISFININIIYYLFIGQDENNLWTSYSGMDDNGIPLHITQWKIDFNSLFANGCSSSTYQPNLKELVHDIRSRVHRLIILPTKKKLSPF